MNRVALVVDDDPAVLELLAEMLEELGCEVLTQQNAAEALTVLRKDRRIEILLTDINMPGIAGFELAEQAKRLRPGGEANTGIGTRNGWLWLSFVAKAIFAERFGPRVERNDGPLLKCEAVATALRLSM